MRGRPRVGRLGPSCPNRAQTFSHPPTQSLHKRLSIGRFPRPPAMEQARVEWTRTHHSAVTSLSHVSFPGDDSHNTRQKSGEDLLLQSPVSSEKFSPYGRPFQLVVRFDPYTGGTTSCLGFHNRILILPDTATTPVTGLYSTSLIRSCSRLAASPGPGFRSLFGIALKISLSQRTGDPISLRTGDGTVVP